MSHWKQKFKNPVANAAGPAAQQATGNAPPCSHNQPALTAPPMAAPSGPNAPGTSAAATAPTAPPVQAMNPRLRLKAKAQEDAERKRKQEEEAARAEQERKAREAEEARKAQEAEEQRQREEEEKRKREAEKQRQREAEEQRRQEAEEQRRREEEEQRLKELEEQRRKEAEEQRRREAEEQRKKEAEEARKRKAAAAAAAAAAAQQGVDLLEDMFVTLPSVPVVLSKPDEPEAPKLVKKASVKTNASGDTAPGKGSKADKPSKRPRELDTTGQEGGEGGLVHKKSKDSTIQAHNSLTGSTDKADHSKPSTDKHHPDTVKATKKQRTGDGGDADGTAAGKGSSKPSKQPPTAASKDVVMADAEGERRGVQTPAVAATAAVSPSKLGSNVAVVKPGDNGSQDPAARKPAVVQAGAPSTTGTDAKGTAKKEGMAGKTKEGAGGKAREPGEKGAHKQMSKEREKGAGAGKKDGERKAASGKPAVELQAAAGAGRTESATHGGSETRIIDCILESARPAAGSGGSGVPCYDPHPLAMDLARGAGSGLDNNSSGSQSVLTAKVDLSKAKDMDDLWKHLREAFNSNKMPDQYQAHLIYMDHEGDWMLAMPEQPFAMISSCARKLLISPKG